MALQAADACVAIWRALPAPGFSWIALMSSFSHRRLPRHAMQSAIPN